MAYLDKNGIPRVDEGTKTHNEHIDNAVDMLQAITNSIEQSCSIIKNDNYIENREDIVVALEHCKEVVNILIGGVKNSYMC